MSHSSFFPRIAAPVLAFGMALALVGCGNDDGDGKTVANTPTGNQTALPDSSAMVAAAESPIRSKTNDVLDWLKLSPEKADKAAEKKAAEAAAAAAAAAKAAEAPKPAAPVQVALATPAPVTAPAPVPVERPVLQPVSANARETIAPGPASAPAPAPAVVASAAPTAAAAAAPAPAVALKLVSREQPAFPREAMRNGVHAGHVKARIQVNADGTVKAVDIIESSPTRVFDRAVIAAALQWRYAPMAEPASTVTEFDFNGDE